MAFELSEAFVSLTNRGFDQTITSTDGVEASLRKMMTQADSATESVDKGLVEAMAAAASGMIETGEASAKAFDGLEKSSDGVRKSVKQWNEEIRKAKKAEEDAASAAKKVAEEIAEVEKAAKKVGDAVGQWSIEMNAGKEAAGQWSIEMNAAKDSTKETSDAAGGAVDAMEEGQGVLESWTQSAKDFVNKLSQGEGRFAKMARGAGRMLGIIGAVSAAASEVYNWVLRWQEGSSGFNDANKKALESIQQIGKQQTRITEDAIRDANRLNSSKETLIALEGKLALAQRNNDSKQKAKREKEEALTPGALGQFADGKVNSELAPEFEQAKAAADASQKSVDMLAAEIRRLKNEGKDFDLGIEQDLKRARILAEEGEEALRAFDLTKDLGEERAKAVAAEEQALKTQEEQRRAGEALAETYRQQLQTLEFQTIELNEGKEAAAKARDEAAGFDVTQRAQLANARALNDAATKAAARRDESKKLAEEETKRQEALGKSFAQQVNALAAKNIALQKGNEAAARFKDEAKGFNEEQRETLAILRARNEALSDLDEAKKNEDKLTKKADDREGQFVGFSQLAKSSSPVDNALKKAQEETARATAALAKQATTEGIKIKQVATSAPRVDRRFGRGASDGANIYKRRREG